MRANPKLTPDPVLENVLIRNDPKLVFPKTGFGVLVLGKIFPKTFVFFLGKTSSFGEISQNCSLAVAMSLRACCSCQNELPKECFGAHQLKKGPGRSLCVQCVLPSASAEQQLVDSDSGIFTATPNPICRQPVRVKNYFICEFTFVLFFVVLLQI